MPSPSKSRASKVCFAVDVSMLHAACHSVNSLDGGGKRKKLLHFLTGQGETSLNHVDQGRRHRERITHTPLTESLENSDFYHQRTRRRMVKRRYSGNRGQSFTKSRPCASRWIALAHEAENFSSQKTQLLVSSREFQYKQMLPLPPQSERVNCTMKLLLQQARTNRSKVRHCPEPPIFVLSRRKNEERAGG